MALIDEVQALKAKLTAIADAIRARMSGGYTNLVDKTAWNTGYRINSSGKLTASANGAVSNFIPAKPGDVIRIKGWDFTQTPTGGNSYIYGYPAASEATNSGVVAVGTSATGTGNISYAYDKITHLSDGTLEFVLAVNNSNVNRLSNDCLYVRVNGKAPSNLDDVIITINEEITSGGTGAPMTLDEMAEAISDL